MDKRQGEIFFFQRHIEVSPIGIPHEVVFLPGTEGSFLRVHWVTSLKSAHGPQSAAFLWGLFKKRCALDFTRIMEKVF